MDTKVYFLGFFSISPIPHEWVLCLVRKITVRLPLVRWRHVPCGSRRPVGRYEWAKVTFRDVTSRCTCSCARVFHFLTLLLASCFCHGSAKYVCILFTLFFLGQSCQGDRDFEILGILPEWPMRWELRLRIIQNLSFCE